MKPQFEHVRHSCNASFACLEYEGAAFDCPYHVHPEVEILLIQGGSGRFLVGTKVGRFGPGDLFIFGPNLPHMFNSNPSPPGKRARSRYIQFGMNCLGSHFLELPEIKHVRRLLKLARRGLRFPSGSDPRLPDKFAAVYSTDAAERVAALLVLWEGLAASTAAERLANEGYLCEQTHRESTRLERAFAYINRHLNGTLSLADTARAASFSPQAFSRFFHKHIGMTFQDYVIDLRLVEACRLLIETDRTVTEICFQAGFNNLSNFNRLFLERKGMTPRRFRRLIEPGVSRSGFVPEASLPC